MKMMYFEMDAEEMRANRTVVDSVIGTMRDLADLIINAYGRIPSADEAGLMPCHEEVKENEQNDSI